MVRQVLSEKKSLQFTNFLKFDNFKSKVHTFRLFKAIIASYQYIICKKN